MQTQDALRELARKLDAKKFGKRGDLVKEYADLYGISVQSVYRRLKTIGWSCGRKQRADAGTTSQDEKALNELAATLKLGVRKNGKVTMETPNARSLLAANGRKFVVSNAQLNRLLKQQRKNTALQKQSRPYQPLRSLHPNHVHQVDPSLCLIYYLKDGSQHIIAENDFYKNKPANLERIENFKVWRYVLVDHYSNTIIVRYYQSHGETQANLFDFLLYSWRQQTGRLFHGVPKRLYWDKGSANTAKAIKNALRSLDVEHDEHKAGNPRAKGAVEGANNTVEKLFESRLRYEPVSNVDELNAAVEHWYNAYNADAIPHYDARLKRPGMAEPKARYALWQIIRQEHLRVLPDEDVCRYLLSADAVERPVRADCAITFKHPAAKRSLKYDLSHIEHVYPRAVVSVSPLIYGNKEIYVSCLDYKNEEHTYVVEPIAVNEFDGMQLEAPVFGEEFKAKPDTLVEKAGKEADLAAFPDHSQEEVEKAKDKNAVPFNGTIDAHSHLAEVVPPSFMRRPGTDLEVPNRVEKQERLLSPTEACKRLLSELGRRDDLNYYELMSHDYPQGITDQSLDKLIASLRGSIDEENLPVNY